MSKEPTKRPSVRIRILEDTMCRDRDGNLVEVKKDQVVEADIIEGPGLVKAGKAERLNEPEAKK